MSNSGSGEPTGDQWQWTEFQRGYAKGQRDCMEAWDAENEARSHPIQPDTVEALRAFVEFVRDWAHDCDDTDAEGNSFYGFPKIEAKARAILAGEATDGEGNDDRP